MLILLRAEIAKEIGAPIARRRWRHAKGGRMLAFHPPAGPRRGVSRGPSGPKAIVTRSEQSGSAREAPPARASRSLRRPCG